MDIRNEKGAATANPRSPSHKDSEKNEFTGLWIPKEIWEMEDLNITEKCFMAVIYSFQNNGKECSASNAWFAKKFGISKKHASQILSNLSRKKRIGIQIYRD